MKIVFLTQQYTQGQGALHGGEMETRAYLNSLIDNYGGDSVKIVKVPVEKNTLRRQRNYLALRNMYSREKERELIREINGIDWDILFFDGSWSGRISGYVVKKGKIVTFLHNVEHIFCKERLKRSPLSVIRFCSDSYNEKCLMRNSDYVITLNHRDEELVKRCYHRQVDLILPISLKDCYQEYPAVNNNPRKLLFVGSYFDSNVQGVLWFVKKVMPRVDCQFIVAGKGMERIKSIETPQISILGTVDDLSKLYQECDAVVMPIFSGGGMKVKTAEALMWGKRILATREALTGYDVRGLECVKECNTADEFAEAIGQMRENSSFSLAAREVFLEKYEESVKSQKLAAFLERIK